CRSSSDRYWPDRAASASRAGGRPPFSVRCRYPVLQTIPTRSDPLDAPTRPATVTSTRSPSPAAAGVFVAPSTRLSASTCVLRLVLKSACRQPVRFQLQPTATPDQRLRHQLRSRLATAGPC